MRTLRLALLFLVIFSPIFAIAQDETAPTDQTEQSVDEQKPEQAQQSPSEQPENEQQQPEQAPAQPQTAEAPPQPQGPPIPPTIIFAELAESIQNNPMDLDAYFQYANIATQLGKAQEAVDAYKHMLEVNPELHRIKLDLGLLYTRMGEFKLAKPLFEEVLATNPPEQVKANIGKVLETVNNNLRTDIISGSVTVGLNQDTNANSSSSSGQTTFSGISIPLADSSTAKKDAQFMTAVSLSHLHKFDIDSKFWGASLTTTGTFYKTQQESENQLDLRLFSYKTGPIFDLKKLRMQIGASFSESYIQLASQDYIRSPSGDLTLKYAPLNNLIFDYTFTYEYRKFINSPNITTNSNRSGNAHQNKAGITYALTPKDIFNTSMTWRSEEASYEAFGNDQLSATGSYTRQLPYDMAFNTLLSFKKSHYNDFDTSVSTTEIRGDRERSMAFTLAKKLPKNITVSLGYQYKNAKSNIQNYQYVDHKTSATIGWSF
jgi:hypothetical protein